MWFLLPSPTQDITSLLHTIYEVVDSSVNHSPTSSKTLRVKLTVAPDGSQGKKSILLNHPGEGPGGPPCDGWRGILGALAGICLVGGWALSRSLKELGLKMEGFQMEGPA